MESYGISNTGNTPARMSASRPPAPCPGIGRVLRLGRIGDWWLGLFNAGINELLMFVVYRLLTNGYWLL